MLSYTRNTARQSWCAQLSWFISFRVRVIRDVPCLPGRDPDLPNRHQAPRGYAGAIDTSSTRLLLAHQYARSLIPLLSTTTTRFAERAHATNSSRRHARTGPTSTTSPARHPHTGSQRKQLSQNPGRVPRKMCRRRRANLCRLLLGLRHLQPIARSRVSIPVLKFNLLRPAAVAKARHIRVPCFFVATHHSTSSMMTSHRLDSPSLRRSTRMMMAAMQRSAQGRFGWSSVEQHAYSFSLSSPNPFPSRRRCSPTRAHSETGDGRGERSWLTHQVRRMLHATTKYGTIRYRDRYCCARILSSGQTIRFHSIPSRTHLTIHAHELTNSTKK